MSTHCLWAKSHHFICCLVVLLFRKLGGGKSGHLMGGTSPHLKHRNLSQRSLQGNAFQGLARRRTYPLSCTDGSFSAKGYPLHTLNPFSWWAGLGALSSIRVQGYAYCYLHRRARFIPSQGLIGCSHLDCFEYFALFKWQDSKPLRNKNTYRSCRLWSGSRND